MTAPSYDTLIWVQLIVYGGMVSILLYCGYMLVIAPVVSRRELDKKKEKLLSTIGTIILAVFALTKGISIVGDLIGVDTLYSEASKFLDTHLRWTTNVMVVSGIVLFILDLASNLPGKWGIFSQIGASAIEDPLTRLSTIAEIIAIHKIMLTLGHEIVMTHLFPLGLLFMLFRPLKGAGAVLVAFSLAMWIVLPAIIVYIYIPWSDMLGLSTPPLEAFAISSATVAIPPLGALVNLIERFTEYGFTGIFDWYAAMLNFWIHATAIGFIFLFISMLALTVAIGGGSIIMAFQRLISLVMLRRVR